MMVAILGAVVGAMLLALLMVAALKREPRRARSGDARASGDVSWMRAGASDGCDSDGGGCGGDGGGGGGD